MTEEVITAPARWREDPEIVADVHALADRYRSDDLDIPQVLCDAHPAEAIAFVCVAADGAIRRLTYGDLGDRSKRLARALQARGVRQGDRIGVLMAKTERLPVVLLALWRLGAVHVPLFTAFAGPAIAQRVRGAAAVLVVADGDQRDKLRGLDVPVLDADADLESLIADHPPLAGRVTVGGAGLFIQLYTSGTTGTPKAVGVPGFAIGAFLSYFRYGLDVRADDVFWNAADPGWAYGLYYAIVAPMAAGSSNILLAGAFAPEALARTIDELRVTNLAASPTVYRALKKSGATPTRPLRALSSAGEPLTPDVVAWAPEALGADIRDQWGQTEQGMAIANAWHPSLRRPVAPGSMGQALPGFVGGMRGASIALSVTDSPLMWFRGYVDAPEQTRERFTADARWYLTGDVGRISDGDFFFSSRDDDVILAAGYRIAPFDIESILASQPAVAEVAVVGRPDEIRGEVVEAFVVLSEVEDPERVTSRLQTAVREHYGAHAYPRRVHVVRRLPRTPSGKVQRFILRSLTREQIDELARD